MAVLPVVDSKLKVLEFPRFLVFGAPKEGKTLMAATASAKFPREILEGKRPAKHVYLDDLLYFRFDNGGNDSLAEWNISAPEVDLSATFGGQIVPAIESLGETALYCAKQGTKVIVLDTFSTLDAVLKAHFSKKFEAEGEKGQMRMWGQILAQHIRLIDLLRPVKAMVIYNCHAKVRGESFGEAKDSNQKNRMAVGMPVDGGLIVPDISGAAFLSYHGIASGILPLAKRVINGKTVRTVFPRGYRGLQGCNRFNSLLDNEEPADFYSLLKKIQDKITAIESDPSAVNVVDEAQEAN